VARIREATDIDPELIFVSHGLRLSVGLPGRVEPSLIRLDRYLKRPVERAARAVVTVGRVSRDVIEKHDPQDAALYRMLAARGMRVRIMGGSCLRPWLQDVPGVELLPAGAEEVTQFLASLDIFFYRTGTFIEPYGRVVLEAMASGLPVVVAANGGYAEQINPGVEGFPVQSQEQALHVLQVLANDPTLRLQIGQAARTRAVEVHGPDAIASMLDNYLG
jgi:glycosyltransferase involved in cell wall biosynthesis